MGSRGRRPHRSGLTLGLGRLGHRREMPGPGGPAEGHPQSRRQGPCLEPPPCRHSWHRRQGGLCPPRAPLRAHPSLLSWPEQPVSAWTPQRASSPGGVLTLQLIHITVRASLTTWCRPRPHTLRPPPTPPRLGPPLSGTLLSAQPDTGATPELPALSPQPTCREESDPLPLRAKSTLCRAGTRPPPVGSRLCPYLHTALSEGARRWLAWSRPSHGG